MPRIDLIIWAAGLILMVCCTGVAYWLGSSHGRASAASRYEQTLARIEREANNALRDAIEQAQASERRNAEVSRAAEAAHAAEIKRIQQQNKRAINDVESYWKGRPAPAADCGLDADGVRLWNRANRPDGGHP